MKYNKGLFNSYFYLYNKVQNLVYGFDRCLINVDCRSLVDNCAWRIPGTEEAGGLQSTGSLGIRHD